MDIDCTELFSSTDDINKIYLIMDNMVKLYFTVKDNIIEYNIKKENYIKKIKTYNKLDIIELIRTQYNLFNEKTSKYNQFKYELQRDIYIDTNNKSDEYVEESSIISLLNKNIESEKLSELKILLDDIINIVIFYSLLRNN